MSVTIREAFIVSGPGDGTCTVAGVPLLVRTILVLQRTGVEHCTLVGASAPSDPRIRCRVDVAPALVPPADSALRLVVGPGTVIDRALADEGPLTRLQLRERVESAGVPTARQTLLNLLFLASLRGVAVRGPMVGKEHAYVRLDDWIEPVKPVEREPALAELARRYLAGHAPADDRDLARWAGLPLRDARAGLAAIASELVEREDGLVHLAARRPRPETPSPRLLGAFDPVLLGWTSREPILGPHTHLTTMNGIFRPFAMVEGRAVGGWKLNRGRVEIEPLEPIAKPATAELAADAADVERFIASA